MKTGKSTNAIWRKKFKMANFLFCRDHYILKDCQDDGNNQFGDISSFAVFDGHGGVGKIKNPSQFHS